MTPYWSSGVDMSKFNFGLAYYGRGFTLADTGCSSIGCGAAGGNNAGSCSNSAGYLSGAEIQALGGSPQLNETAMVQQLVYNDNQWIAYDDDASIKLKLGVSYMFKIQSSYRLC